MNRKFLIISGTNRKGSNTLKVAKQYQLILKELGQESDLVSLEEMDLAHRNPSFESFEAEFLVPAGKYIFIVPEYNGSMPGVLKSMFDISRYNGVWNGKKALLVGIASGRSGNVRGLDHLTSILNFMMVTVHPNKLPISSIDKLLNGANLLTEPSTLLAIRKQLQDFVDF